MPNRPRTHRPPSLPQRRAPDRRPSAAARGYGGSWRRLRLMVLREEPLCRACLAAGREVPAVHVDHVDGDVGNLDRSNLQGLCPPCHSRKTVRCDGAFGRPKKSP